MRSACFLVSAVKQTVSALWTANVALVGLTVSHAAEGGRYNHYTLFGFHATNGHWLRAFVVSGYSFG
jgi:hypothetical protein